MEKRKQPLRGVLKNKFTTKCCQNLEKYNLEIKTQKDEDKVKDKFKPQKLFSPQEKLFLVDFSRQSTKYTNRKHVCPKQIIFK